MRSLSQVLDLVRPYLAGNGGEHHFLCIAAIYAERDGVITEPEEQAFRRTVMARIHPHSALRNHLCAIGAIDVSMSSRHPEYWPYRDQWLDLLQWDLDEENRNGD